MELFENACPPGGTDIVKKIIKVVRAIYIIVVGPCMKRKWSQIEDMKGGDGGKVDPLGQMAQTLQIKTAIRSIIK